LLKSRKQVGKKRIGMSPRLFPGSQVPALQTIDDPIRPVGESLFEVDLILVRPSEIDHLVLQEGEEKRVAHLDDIFEEWNW
jgi:hypothetical protein